MQKSTFFLLHLPVRSTCSLIGASLAAAILATQIAAAQSPDQVPIGLVQGAIDDSVAAPTHKSPMVNDSVVVQGLIHQIILRYGRGDDIENGFFIQNTPATADGNARTSDGIFVLCKADLMLKARDGTDYIPQPGDEIVVRGKIREYFNLTHLVYPELVRVVRTGVDVDDVLPHVEPPTFPDSDAAGLFWERHEGMRLWVPEGSSFLGGCKVFGTFRDAEAWVSAPSPVWTERSDPYARRVFRDAHPLDDITEHLFDNENPNRLCLGSLGIKGFTGDIKALLAAHRTFDTLKEPTAAAVYQRYETYSLQPERPLSTVRGPDPSLNGRMEPLPPSKHFTVVTYNLENLFDHRDDPTDDCDAPTDKGNDQVHPPFNYLPDSAETYHGRLQLMADQISRHLHSPDIVLVQEAEDQDLLSPDGTGWIEEPDGQIDCLQQLAAAIRAAGGPSYLAAGDRNGAGYRGITCGFLYREDRASLVEPTEDHPLFGAEPAFVYRGEPLATNVGTRNPKALNSELPLDVDLSTGMSDTNVFPRAVQVACFRIQCDDDATRTADLYVLNNHFSSRPNQRVGQRIEQARHNAALVHAVLQQSPGAMVLVGGDLNVYPRPDDPFRDPPRDQLGPLYDAGLANAFDWMLNNHAPSAYSYVYKGQAGTLDQFFLSPALQRSLAHAWAVHMNADWTSGGEDSEGFGVSDHDPILATFRFPASD